MNKGRTVAQHTVRILHTRATPHRIIYNYITKIVLLNCATVRMLYLRAIPYFCLYVYKRIRTVSQKDCAIRTGGCANG